MKALRWILFSLLAFGIGTGAALALHPPTIGIPTATASRLANDLSKINEYAADGNCGAVRGRLNGAASKIDKLPPRTASATVDQLTASLATVRSEAIAACQKVADARMAKEQAAQDARDAQEAAEATPTPQAEEPEPSTPSEDPGLGTDDPGTTDTTPEQQPDGGLPSDGSSGEGDTGGGVVLPGEDAIRQKIDKQRKKWKERTNEIRKAWGLQ